MIWIHNVTPEGTPNNEPHDYEVKINRRTLVRFKHVRNRGAAECFRAAADALDAAELNPQHDNGAKNGKT